VARRPPRPPRPAPDAAAAEAAVASFLAALGLPPEVRAGPDLAETPRRVAEAWLEELADGYGRDPARILAGALPSRARDLVAVTGIDYVSVCPHHLLPSRGVAHVAYLPGGRVAGFGQVVKVVDALSHRLVLAEELAADVAGALVEHLGARGAACLLEAEHLCLSVRGERRPRARAHAEAWVGELALDGPARRRFLSLCPRGLAGAGEGARRPRARKRR